MLLSILGTAEVLFSLILNNFNRMRGTSAITLKGRVENDVMTFISIQYIFYCLKNNSLQSWAKLGENWISRFNVEFKVSLGVHDSKYCRWATIGEYNSVACQTFNIIVFIETNIPSIFTEEANYQATKYSIGNTGNFRGGLIHEHNQKRGNRAVGRNKFGYFCFRHYW